MIQALLAMVMLASPPPDPMSSQGYRTRVLPHLEQARQAVKAREADQAFEHYQDAWEAAVIGLREGAFGKKKFSFGYGDIQQGTYRTEDAEIPAGEGIPPSVAREAILAADYLEQPEKVADWLSRLSPLAGISARVRPGLSREAIELLETLQKKAQADHRDFAASTYHSLLNQEDTRREQVTEQRHQRKSRNLLIALVIYLLAQLPILFFEGRWFFRTLAERRKEGPRRVADAVVLRSARVTESAKGLAFSTTFMDLFGRVSISWLMRIWVPGALVGAVVFFKLALDHPGQPGTLGLSFFLVWLFISFAGLMIMFAAGTPPASVQRETAADDMGFSVTTRVGVIFRREWTEAFEKEDLVGFYLDRHEERHKYGRIVSWLIRMQTTVHRDIVLGGQPEQHEYHARQLVERLNALRDPGQPAARSDDDSGWSF